MSAYAPPLACSAPRPQPGTQGIARIAVDDASATITVTFLHDLTPQEQQYAYDASAYVLTGGEVIFPKIMAASKSGARAAVLQLDRIGDFSAYLLAVRGFDVVDPFFASASVRFRVGCDDATDPESGAVTMPPPSAPVVVDYLAKDYASFRQALLDFAAARYPDWTERSEADVTMVMLELFAWAGDMLSYMQDRVGNEAFLETATQRRSVAAHLALIGYAIDQGSSAHAWLRFTVDRDVSITAAQPVQVANRPLNATDALIVYETFGAASLVAANDVMPLYDYGNGACTLAQSALSAALGGAFTGLTAGAYVMLHDRASGTRDVVRLAADARTRTIAGEAVTEIAWLPTTPLSTAYDVLSTVVYGNVVLATHGETLTNAVLRELTPEQRSQLKRDDDDFPPGVLPLRNRVPLPTGPLAFIDRSTLALGAPLGAAAGAPVSTTARVPKSDGTLTVFVEGDDVPWVEIVSLLDAGPDDRVFAIDVDDAGEATIVFGDGVHGRVPPDDATIRGTYRVGGGALGNVAADTLVVVRNAPAGATWMVTNPLPATGGRSPQSSDAARRFATAAFETPLALIAADDYASAATAFRTPAGAPLASAARASFAWTGSWSTARVTVAPANGTSLDPQTAEAIRAQLDLHRLAGYDVEVVPPRGFPIALEITATLAPGADPHDVRAALASAFGTGSSGFFRPGAFGFGDPVYLSRIDAAALAVRGVAGVRIDRLAPLSSARPAEATRDAIRYGALTVPHDRIVRLDDDPNAPQNGILRIRLVPPL